MAFKGRKKWRVAECCRRFEKRKKSGKVQKKKRANATNVNMVEARLHDNHHESGGNGRLSTKRMKLLFVFLPIGGNMADGSGPVNDIEKGLHRKVNCMQSTVLTTRVWQPQRCSTLGMRNDSNVIKNEDSADGFE